VSDERKGNVDRIEALAVAGGGTGGHLFPGLAIAEEFRKGQAGIRILYIGVAGKMEEQVIPASGMTFHGLKVKGLKGKGLPGKLAGVSLAGKAVMECRTLLRSFRPDLLVGVGGYSSGPAALAAWTLGIPVVLQEQNTVPGMTNRILGRVARKTFLAFEEAASFFPEGSTAVTGNPLRKGALGKEREVAGGGKVRVLILGGSRGARGVNRLVVDALPLLGGAEKGMTFVHQSGAEDHSWVERSYRELKVDAEVRTFIDGLGEKYSWADVVISRSGAGAVSELAANGRPAILIPFPRAAGDHQRKNARWLSERGGAVMVSETGDGCAGRLAAVLKDLAADGERLRDMARRSRDAGRRDAAARIVAECREILAVKEGG
jgi:UDP-N-acetylglucosamine--N-acetylmuramyl-(pentapeptide) pyrophosphoryl-undecaprenol N-acetylglucosamine transferase